MGAVYPRDFILVRLTSDGVLDPSFNGTGYVITSIGADWDEANALGMQPDGKIVLAGFAALDPNNDLPEPHGGWTASRGHLAALGANR